MSYSVLNLKQDLTGVMHGTQLNNIQNLNGIINRSARQLLLDLDPQETKRILQFTNPIYNGVVDYPIAADVKGNKLIDIRPQVNRLPRDVWTQAYNQAFDIAKSNVFSSPNMFTLNFNSGLKTIRINAPYLSAPVVQNSVDSITSNGTWAVGGGASNLAIDSQNYVQSQGSLSFNLPSGAGYIENSTMSQTDLTKYLNQGALFVWVYMPTASQFTSVNLRWGSDAANYYSVTSTQTQQGTAFQNGWNIIQFNWLGAAVTGSPVVTATDYLRVTCNTTAIQTAAKVDYITVSLGNYMEYEYYSKFLFRNSSTGVFQETVLDDADLINLDTDSYNILFNCVAYLTTQQQQGLDASFYDGSFFGTAYLKGIESYKSKYKSEVQKPQSNYYTPPNTGYGRYIGRLNG